MPGDIIPSFYKTEIFGGKSSQRIYEGMTFGNTFLVPGEVKRIIKPSDLDSRSKKFYEYNVYATHRENNTAAGRIYHNCFAINDLGGLADKVEKTFRIDDTEQTDSGNQDPSQEQDIANGKGSKVLLLCIGGVYSEAVIVGGLRDDTDSDDEELGHHYTFVFNGTTIKVELDGSYSIRVDGATKANGDPSDDRVDGGGSSIRVDANGDVAISTDQENQSIAINNQDGAIIIKADEKLVLDGSQIQIGADSTEPGVLGNQLVILLNQLLPICAAIASAIPAQAGVPMATQLTALQSTVSTILSQTVTVKE
jgi:hypothetical protein